MQFLDKIFIDPKAVWKSDKFDTSEQIKEMNSLLCRLETQMLHLLKLNDDNNSDIHKKLEFLNDQNNFKYLRTKASDPSFLNQFPYIKKIHSTH